MISVGLMTLNAAIFVGSGSLPSLVVALLCGWVWARVGGL